ncbi:hypothetical protein DM793_18880 [Paenarthrobacter nitroguajacolicus]|uniref:hypothetical protein n=1 Tax=Paenarthrobacter nitroguajacolicus TaxID=211146 RepID=UPI0015BE0296|nr:hypothetical protein [Paenarthrobacter nitroguajacolicus]NWL13334.1 hypothetical protein [Paenarthrobacter nitroguajacolicus]
MSKHSAHIARNQTSDSEAANDAEIQTGDIHASGVSHVVLAPEGKTTTNTSVIRGFINNAPRVKKLPGFVGRGSRFTSEKNLSALFDAERKGDIWYDTL